VLGTSNTTTVIGFAASLPNSGRTG
jgi:hypothetical protein